MKQLMTNKEPEIIINGVNIGPGCSMTIRVALEVFANQLVLDNDLPDQNTDVELNKNYLNRIKDIREVMGLYDW